MSLAKSLDRAADSLINDHPDVKSWLVLIVDENGELAFNYQGDIAKLYNSMIYIQKRMSSGGNL